mgnify:FL=1|tara:strand:- start:86 stop:322 length:237 start_codon:yes stop_codon:yes gene_type:complete
MEVAGRYVMINNIDYKRCSTCRKWKPNAEFYFRVSGKRNKTCSYCSDKSKNHYHNKLKAYNTIDFKEKVMALRHRNLQ